MALPKFYKVCQDQQGNIVPQVLGSVFNHGTAVLASLYQDDAGTVPLSNPMTSDAQYGSFKFYVNPGHYDLTFTKPGYTFEPIDDLQVPQDVLTLGTMATQNANAVAITGGTIAGVTLPLGTMATQNATAVAISGGTAHGLSTVRVMTSLMVDSLNREVLVNAPINITHAKGSGASGLAILPNDSNTGGGAEILFLNTAVNAVGSITTTASATAFNTSSDARLKHAVQALSGALAAILALRPVSYRWNVDESVGHGFLAHELQATIPDAVSGEPDAVNADGSIQPQQVDHSKLVVWLCGAVQELAQRVTSLETQLGI